MTFEEVEKICKEKAAEAGVKLVLHSKDLVDCFGKNQAAQSDGEIILGEYDSPELMALCFGQQSTVFIDKAFAAKDHILRAFAVAASAVNVAADASGALLG